MYRDDDELAEALIHYNRASDVAASARERDTESAASELIASVHNERQEYGAAEYFARHAAEIARRIDDRIRIARAEEEHAIALRGRRDVDGSIGAYTRAIVAMRAGTMASDYGVSLLRSALAMCAEMNNKRRKVQLLKNVFLESPGRVNEEEDGPEIVFKTIARIADTGAPLDHLVPVIALAMEDLWDDVPEAIGRRIVVGTINGLLVGSSAANRTRHAAIATVMSLEGANSLTLGDICHVNDRLAEVVDGFYFKPQLTGGGHWTVRLQSGGGIVISIVQMDDNPRTAATATIVATLLTVLDEDIGEQLLSVREAPRREAVVNIIDKTVFKAGGRGEHGRTSGTDRVCHYGV